jgi:simple sugar transport system substrate-binding protein
MRKRKEEESMAKEDIIHEAVERLEWDERKQEETPLKKLNQVTRRTALTGGAAGLAALALQACGSSSSSSSVSSSTASAATTASGSSAAAVFGVSQTYKFTLVNHVTTNPFFTPTQNGAADACKLLGCSYQWTGSENSNVGEMVNAFNSAVSAGVDGIGVALISLTAFNSPVQKALSAGIPVVAYNADAAGNARLAYIGQDLFVSGQEMGTHIVSLVPSGDIGLFIATPGALNIQPRIDGAQATLKSHPGIKAHVIATGAALPQELSTVQAYIQAHPSYKGFFAVDGGSTQYVGQVLQKMNLVGKVKGGGYDLTPTTQQTVASGALQFTIDQQPYLQGFLPILQMYMYKASQSLSGIADVNTGLKFLTKATVGPYNSTKSRYEGTSTAPGVTKS